MNSPNPSPSNSRNTNTNTNNSPDYSRNTNRSGSPDYSRNGNSNNNSRTQNINLNMVDNSYAQRYNIRQYNRSEGAALNNSANSNNINNVNANNNLVNLNNNIDESGMLVKMNNNRKTLNIPVDLNSGIPLNQRWNNETTGAPPSPANGGLFGGPQAVGEYASIPVIPTATNMINNNLLSANPPPGATTQYPGTNRLGNNFSTMPGINWYNDTTNVNPGQFRIKGPQVVNQQKGGKNKLLKKSQKYKVKRNKTKKSKGGFASLGFQTYPAYCDGKENWSQCGISSTVCTGGKKKLKKNKSKKKTICWFKKKQKK